MNWILAPFRWIFAPFKFLFSMFSYDVHEGDKISYHLIWIIFLAFGGFLLWAYYSEIERVVSATAKAYPYSKLQSVEHFEGGRIEKILVSQGQSVTKGQLLITLSPLQTEGELNIQTDQLAELTVRQSRLLAEYENREGFEIPEKIRVTHPEILNQEEAYFRERKRQRQVQLDSKMAEVNSARAKLEAADVGLMTAQQEYQTMELLFTRGLEPELSFIQARKALADARSSKETSKQELLRTQSTVDAVIREQQTEILKELSELRSKLTSARENIRVAADKADRSELRAPVTGVVNSVLVSTIGGTIRPGEPVVEIVPEGSEIVVEALVSPADIGFIEVGQEALIKITAYDFSVFGSLKGMVDVIAADTTTDEETGQQFYKVTLSFLEAYLDAKGRRLEIIPGMEAQVDIVVGKRSALDYVLSPLLRVTQESLREK